MSKQKLCWLDMAKKRGMASKISFLDTPLTSNEHCNQPSGCLFPPETADDCRPGCLKKVASHGGLNGFALQNNPLKDLGGSQIFDPHFPTTLSFWNLAP